MLKNMPIETFLCFDVRISQVTWNKSWNFGRILFSVSGLAIDDGYPLIWMRFFNLLSCVSNQNNKLFKTKTGLSSLVNPNVSKRKEGSSQCLYLILSLQTIKNSLQNKTNFSNFLKFEMHRNGNQKLYDLFSCYTNEDHWIEEEEVRLVEHP